MKHHRLHYRRRHPSGYQLQSGTWFLVERDLGLKVSRVSPLESSSSVFVLAHSSHSWDVTTTAALEGALRCPVGGLLVRRRSQFFRELGLASDSKYLLLLVLVQG